MGVRMEETASQYIVSAFNTNCCIPEFSVCHWQHAIGALDISKNGNILKYIFSYPHVILHTAPDSSSYNIQCSN